MKQLEHFGTLLIFGSGFKQAAKKVKGSLRAGSMSTVCNLFKEPG